MAHAAGLIRGASHERGEINVSSFLGFKNFYSFFPSPTEKESLEKNCSIFLCRELV